MSIDEQVAEFMVGWLDGIRFRDDESRASTDEPYHRGLDAGHAAYLAAERAERERLSICPRCNGDGMSHRLAPDDPDCPACHGTGRRA